MPKKPEAALALAAKPSLFLTETRLMAACEALYTLDPHGELTPEEADQLLAEYGDPAAAIEKRQELADFLRVADALAASKRAAAEKLKAEAAALETALARCRAGVLRVMRSTGQRALSGESAVLKLEEGRGSVEVLDEKLIPEQFWRVREDEDLATIRTLAALVHEDSEAARAEAAGLLDAACQRRREVDKRAIQKAWSEQGSDVVACPGETATRLMVLADARPESQEFPDHAPVVPGVRKRIDVKLTIK